jgi:hypothetical protein
MKTIQLGLYCAVVALLCCFAALVASIHAHTKLSNSIDSLEHQVVLYQDSIENILNRGDRCDSFATCHWNTTTTIKKVAIRNWPAYHIYLREIVRADSIKNSEEKSHLCDYYLNKWSEEYTKDYSTKAAMLEKLLTGRPDLKTMQSAVFAARVLESEDVITPEIEEKINRLAQSNEIVEINSYSSTLTKYYEKQRDEAEEPILSAHGKAVTAAWNDFLKMNR